MNFKNIFKSISLNTILVIILQLHVLYSPVAAGEIITLYDGLNGEGESLELNVADKCTVMPRGWNDRAMSIRTNGHCYQLYDNKHCDGHSIRIDNTEQRQRVINLHELSFQEMTGSIMPCTRIQQSPSLHQFGTRTNQHIILYELVNYGGAQVGVMIDRCTNIPPPMYKNVASLDTRGKCVRLYDEINCTGNVIQIQPNDPDSNNLHFYDFIDKASSAGPCFGRRLK